MTEAEARQALLVRAVEEEDPSLVPAEVSTAAWRVGGDRADPVAFCLRRSAFLLETLPERVRGLIFFELPPRDLALPLLVLAAAAGLLSNGLSLGRRVHLLANPVTALVLWNLAVYALMLATRARRTARGPSGSGAAAPLRPLLSLIARAGLLWSRVRGQASGGSVTGSTTRVRVRFAADYATLCAPAILARCERLAHGGAIAFALGALAGILLQGVAFEYRVEWGSTLVSSPEMRAHLAALIFLPARLLLGTGFPDAGQLALAATPEGAPAAIWFHVFALTVMSVVLLPRAALAVIASRRARRLARAVVLPEADPYWRRLANRPHPPSDAAFDKTLLPHFSLDARACTLLASLEADLVAEDIGATPAGGRLDTLGRKKAWFERWRLLVDRGLAAFPGRDRPRLLDPQSEDFERISAEVRSGENPFGSDLILLELAAFEAYGPLAPGDTRLRDRVGLAPSLQQRVRAEALARAARLLGLPASEGAMLRGALGTAHRELSGLWPRVLLGAAAGTALGALTLGIAAPLAAGLVGKAVGAAGLLALKTGLAALGGHAVVGAGLGAAGGTALVVGGGVLLGSDPAHESAPAITVLTPAGALLSSAKIEVFLRRIVAERHHALPIFRAILGELRASVARLRAELPSFRLDPSHTSKQVREREQVISILERVAERNEDWARRHGIA